MPEEIVRSNWTASTNIYRALLIKAIFLCVFAMIALFTYGWHITLAVVYGGGTALLGSLLVAYHMWRAERFIGNDAAKSFRSVMRCELERILLMAILLVIGFAVLKWHPLGILTGFIAIHSLTFIDALRRRV